MDAPVYLARDNQREKVAPSTYPSRSDQHSVLRVSLNDLLSVLDCRDIEGRGHIGMIFATINDFPCAGCSYALS